MLSRRCCATRSHLISLNPLSLVSFHLLIRHSGLSLAATEHSTLAQTQSEDLLDVIYFKYPLLSALTLTNPIFIITSTSAPRHSVQTSLSSALSSSFRLRQLLPSQHRPPTVHCRHLRNINVFLLINDIQIPIMVSIQAFKRQGTRPSAAQIMLSLVNPRR